MNTEITYLEHFGVKGMRWGHRKAQPQSSSESNNSPAAWSNATANTKMSSINTHRSNLREFLKTDKGKATLATVVIIGASGMRRRAVGGVIDLVLKFR